MGQADANLTAGRGVFESIREYIHKYLIEVLAVNPDWNIFAVVVEQEGYLLGFCLVVEEVVDILYESYKICLAHSHLHLSLINLTQVHHLVYQTEYSFCITSYSLVDALSVGVVIGLDK